MTIRDQFNREILIERKPTRLISASPANTEILYALDLAERIVGVTSWCDYPPEVKRKERIGDLVPLNQEKILSLRPDLIIASDINGRQSVENLENLGLTVVAVNPTNIDHSLQAIALLGKITGKERKAWKLVTALQDCINRLEKRKQANLTAGGKEKRLKVLVIVGGRLIGEPIWTAGPGTFLHDAITLTGGTNIAEDIGMRWGQMSLERVLKYNPDLILTEIDSNKFFQDKIWAEVAAVRKEQVYPIDINLFSRPGPRLVNALEELMGIMEKSN